MGGGETLGGGGVAKHVSFPFRARSGPVGYVGKFSRRFTLEKKSRRLDWMRRTFWIIRTGLYDLAQSSRLPFISFIYHFLKYKFAVIIEDIK